MKNYSPLFFLLTMLTYTHWLFCEKNDAGPAKAASVQEKKEYASKKSKAADAKMVWFRYKDEPLANIVNDLATQRGINIMLPQGPSALTSKLTFELSHKISLEKAWQYIITILDLAGFALVPHKDFSFVVRNDATVNKETLPIYLGTDPADLPNTDLKIKYVRYLAYLQVPGSGGAGGPLQDIFSQMLSPTSTVMYEPQLNAVIIIDSARAIKSVMKIIEELDTSDQTQYPQFLVLKYTTASEVKTLFDQLINSDTSTGGGQAPSGASSNRYFSREIKIVAEDRLNMLILLGEYDALQRITEFTRQYIDVPPDDGKSVLHVYDLQYLKAEDFAPILTQIVQSQSNTGGGGGYGSGTGQSSSSGADAGRRYFQEVIITTENAGGGSESGGSVASGTQTGNRLIIAALKDDWTRIERLIRELDKPQLQVLIHGLIVDLSFAALQNLASQLRNPSAFSLRNVDWQSAQIQGVENQSGSPTATPTLPNALQANLLPVASSIYTSGNIASNSTQGTFILSLTDPNTNGVWAITEMVKFFQDAKILSQPLLTTVNNKQVYFKDAQEQRIAGEASQQFGVQVAAQEDVSVTLDLTLLPRISSDRDIVNLSVVINSEYFYGGANTRQTRQVTTNVNLRDRDILVLGGLTQTQTEHLINKTPILGDLPLIGPFFKAQEINVVKSELMIFLRPQIIRPGKSNAIAESYFKRAERVLAQGDGNFSNLKDPITRWFFGPEPKETSPHIIREVRRLTDSVEDRLKKRGFVPPDLETASKDTQQAPSTKAEQPQATHEKKKEDTTKDITTVEPSTKPTPKRDKVLLSQDAEEAQAEEALKQLFGWKDEEQPTATQPAPSQVKSARAATEEQAANQDLAALLNDPELEQMIKATRIDHPGEPS